MPICYKCNFSNSSIPVFKKHMIYHSIPTEERIVCVEKDCFQVAPDGSKKHKDFVNMYSFVCHFKEQHSFSEPGQHLTKELSVSDDLDSPEISSRNNDPLPTYDEVNPADNREESTFQCNSTFLPSIKNFIQLFICKLYANPSTTRSLVQEIIEFSDTLLKESMTLVEKEVLNIVFEADLSDEDKTEKIQNAFNVLKNPFEDLQTEYLRFKFFESQETYIPSKPIPLHTEMVPHNTADAVHVLESEERSLQFIPMRHVLKKFLEQPDVFRKINEHLRAVASETELITDFTQGSLWKNVIETLEANDDSDNSLVWPLYMFTDDYECGNVRGSHAGIHKLCGVYLSLATLPPQFKSILNNIFLFGIFHADDRKVLPHDVLYKPFFDELKYLGEVGIDIDTPTFKGNLKFQGKVKFLLGSMLGDNLGLHQIAGFMESFVANYPCRFCHTHRNELQLQVCKPLALRSIESYDQQVLLNEPLETGIKEPVLWNDLNFFHVVENVACDILHDMLEGVCVWDLELILTFIIRHVYASLDTLNSKIRNFNYGLVYKKNKPPLLTWSKGKVVVKMSAAETLHFTIFFGVLFSCYFPDDDPVWRLYTLLRQIMDIVFAPFFHRDQVSRLQSPVEEHHTLYIQWSDEKHLRNKHHHMLHYAHLMEALGPLINLWVMRYEAKHQHGKKVAVSVATRINLPKTVATRNQLMLHCYLQSGDALRDRLEFGHTSDIVESDLPNPCAGLPLNFVESYEFVSKVTVSGTKYQSSMVIVISNGDIDPVFGLIEAVCISRQNKVGFLCLKLNTSFFNTHVHCFEVKREKEYVYVDYEDLIHYQPTSLVTDSYGNIYVPYKYGL